jgi:hypothetical protein
MSTLELADDPSRGPVPQASDIARLRQAIRGALVLPGDVSFDQARRVWNGMVDNRPGAVVYCAEANDVVTAVGFAGSGSEQEQCEIVRGLYQPKTAISL